MNPTNGDAMRSQRLDHWQGVIEQKLQVLVGEASHYRKQIDTAKTPYKKKYFSKKFKTVQKDVLQLVGTMQNLQAQQQAMTHPSVTGVSAEVNQVAAAMRNASTTISGEVEDATITA